MIYGASEESSGVSARTGSIPKRIDARYKPQLHDSPGENFFTFALITPEHRRLQQAVATSGFDGKIADAGSVNVLRLCQPKARKCKSIAQAHAQTVTWHDAEESPTSAERGNGLAESRIRRVCVSTPSNGQCTTASPKAISVKAHTPV